MEKMLLLYNRMDLFHGWAYIFKIFSNTMDSLIAFKGKDYVILAADTFNAYSVLRMKVAM